MLRLTGIHAGLPLAPQRRSWNDMRGALRGAPAVGSVCREIRIGARLCGRQRCGSQARLAGTQVGFHSVEVCLTPPQFALENSDGVGGSVRRYRYFLEERNLRADHDGAISGPQIRVSGQNCALGLRCLRQ